MRSEARLRAIEFGCEIKPGDACRRPLDGVSRDLRTINGRTGLQHAACGATTVMGVMTALVTLPASRAGIAVADGGGREWIGQGKARRPAGPDRCKNLHQQGNQDYGQKNLQPPAHRKTHPERN